MLLSPPPVELSVFLFFVKHCFVPKSSFAVIFNRKRKLVALLLLSFRFTVTINVLWLFLTVPYVGLQCVIMVFPDRAHFFQVDRDL